MTSERPSVLFPATVRAEVLEQHRELRELLRTTLNATTARLRERGPEAELLALAAHDLRARFCAHLSFEERALVPLLWRVDLWGPERVQGLLAEHARQRAQLDTIIEGIEGDWDIDRLAVTLRSLVTDLLLDMEEEERGTLALEQLQADVMRA
jgi:hypothetical protein